MFAINLKLLGTIITVLAIFFRRKVFDRFGFSGYKANILYFVLLLLIVVPVNMANITFSSLNQKVAEELIISIEKQLTIENVSKPTDIVIMKTNKKIKGRSVFNVRANLTLNGEPHQIFLQPSCSFKEGCTIQANKVKITADEKYDTKTLSFGCNQRSKNQPKTSDKNQHA